MVDSQVLTHLNFPAYCVKVLDNGLVVIAGGGGTAKTGVDNLLQIGKIRYDSQFNATFITIHTFTTSDAIMKFISFKYDYSSNTVSSNNKSAVTKQPSDLFIIAPVGLSIEIYKLMPVIEKTTETTLSPSNSVADFADYASTSQQNSKLRKRQQQQNGTANGNNKKAAVNKNGYNLKASTCLKLVNTIEIGSKADDLNDPKVFAKNQPNVLAVFLPNKKQQKTKNLNEVLLFAGLANGTITAWNILNQNTSTCEKFHEIHNAHLKEVDDLQVHEDTLLSIGRDNKTFLWQITNKNFEKLKEIKYEALQKGKNMRMRHARYTEINPILYATYIPITITKYSNSYIVKYNTTTYKVDAKHEVRNTRITAFQCNKNGNFLCYGDCEGRIELLNDKFQYLFKFTKHHSGVVTDLAFYHDSVKPYDLNKLILTSGIDRTLKCYKYINVKKFNYFWIFLIILGVFILFCYFFTYLE